jgi:hypothetical protein
MNFQTILSPIQFNDSNSLEALRMARRLAVENQARMVVLHVFPKLVEPDLPGYQICFPKMREKHAASSRSLPARICRRAPMRQ